MIRAVACWVLAFALVIIGVPWYGVTHQGTWADGAVVGGITVAAYLVAWSPVLAARRKATR